MFGYNTRATALVSFELTQISAIKQNQKYFVHNPWSILDTKEICKLAGTK